MLPSVLALTAVTAWLQVQLYLSTHWCIPLFTAEPSEQCPCNHNMASKQYISWQVVNLQVRRLQISCGFAGDPFTVGDDGTTTYHSNPFIGSQQFALSGTPGTDLYKYLFQVLAMLLLATGSSTAAVHVLQSHEAQWLI